MSEKKPASMAQHASANDAGASSSRRHSKKSLGFGGEGDVLCALRDAESRGEFSRFVAQPNTGRPITARDIESPREQVRPQNASTSHHQTRSKTMERTMGHIGPHNAQFIDYSSDDARNPQVGQSHNESRNEPCDEPRNEYDALADLFLSHDDARSLLTSAAKGVTDEGGPALRLHTAQAEPAVSVAPTAAPVKEEPRPQRPRIECVVDTSRSGTNQCLAQYAAHVAAKIGGSVGVVRLTDNQVVVDLFAVAEQDTPESANAYKRGTSAVYKNLLACINAASSKVLVWMLHTENTGDNWWRHVSGLDEVKLLTHADDASLIGAYKTLKSIASGNPSGSTHHSRIHLSNVTASKPAISVGVFANRNDRFHAARQKLQRGAQTFLGLSLANVERIGNEQFTLTMDSRGPNQEHNTLFRETFVTGTGDAIHTANCAESVVTMIRDCQSQEERVDQRTSSSESTRHQLALDVSGLTPIGVTCPYAASVEVAFDAEGVVHLLTSDESGSVASLLVAFNWAKAHAHMLQVVIGNATHASRANNVESSDRAAAKNTNEPTLHLFTKDLRSTRRLLDTPVRVHLVVEVPCQGQITRVVRCVN